MTVLKICCTCKEEKKVGEFRRDKSRKDGRQSYCKVCARSKIQERYQLKYGAKYRERNQKYYADNMQRLQTLKQTLKCEMCPEQESVCLDFHHRDESTKTFGVSESMFRSWKTIEVEIQKCAVVCSNCHRKIHAGLIKLQ